MLRVLMAVAIAVTLVVGAPTSAQERGSVTGAAPPPRPALTFSATLKHAAYHDSGVPSVAVHVPAGFDPTPPLELVIFLHGFMGCTQVLIADGPARCRPADHDEPGWALAARHDEAHSNSVLVIPQLAFMKRSSKPGCFARGGCFDAFLDELLAELRARLSLPPLERSQLNLTLVAHSAGYQTALAILDRARSAERVQRVVLMDALYGGAPQFNYWLQRAARRHARMLSIYLGGGGTQRGNRDLYRRARRALGKARVIEAHHDGLDAALRSDKTLIVSTGRGIHRLVPENYLAKVLAAWLPARK